MSATKRLKTEVSPANAVLLGTGNQVDNTAFFDLLFLKECYVAFAGEYTTGYVHGATSASDKSKVRSCSVLLMIVVVVVPVVVSLLGEVGVVCEQFSLGAKQTDYTCLRSQLVALFIILLDQGVVALTMFDLRARGKIGTKIALCGTSGGKFPGLREHLKTNIADCVSCMSV